MKIFSENGDMKSCGKASKGGDKDAKIPLKNLSGIILDKAFSKQMNLMTCLRNLG